ncbi:MAG: hypothetical protein Q4D85_01750 [Corynebacterium sp.]|uniref:hypothetical protein n=1 Tax=Corynebacterium sp. TaxID=1720 RepID=UPI0026DD1EEE|nr:hypothetical protein [Corynebacterium sp.]MDO5097453.1 hypothetical protein [Corynebacterium sp.]
MAPKTITLRDGESHVLATGSFLRLRAWLVHGQAVDVELVTPGATTLNRPDPAQVYLTGCDNRVGIVVRPSGGGQFPPEHSVSVVVEQPTAGEHIRLELPVVRVDGASERLIGEIHPVAGQPGFVAVSAIGSNVAVDLPREAMTMVSALRALEATECAATSLHLLVDASAAMCAHVSVSDLRAVEHAVLGIADHFDITVAGDVETQLTDFETHAPVRVGRPELETTTKPDHVVVVLTDSPRPVLSKLRPEPIVMVIGTHAEAEVRNYHQLYGADHRLTLVPWDEKQIAALTEGNHDAIADNARLVATALQQPAVVAITNPFADGGS